MIRLAAAQINSTVGDLRGNSEKILACIENARGLGVDVVSFPELALTGYPPEDLLLKAGFIDDNLRQIKELAAKIGEIAVIVGFADKHKNHLYNAAAVIQRGNIRGIYHKQLLPNYGVFDEKRYFDAGTEIFLFSYKGVVFGVNICEDIWLKGGPTGLLSRYGAGLVFNINASPYHAGKGLLREEMVRERVGETGLYVCYTNLVGGQDELVFDGQSFIMNNKGEIIRRGHAFCEDLVVADIPLNELERKRTRTVGYSKKKGVRFVSLGLKGTLIKPVEIEPTPCQSLNIDQEVYEALKLGLGDYVCKNGFRKAVIGLSGGIDSAIVAVLAVDALGKENVTGVFMPSRYTSSVSREDAEVLAVNLGIELLNVPIDEIYRSYMSTLGNFFPGRKEDITEENLQARIRGNILMALSNKFGWLVLTTGNKSEMSVGYATLYGDMAGGFAVIKDVPKTLVYEISRYRNSLGAVIPERILSKEPTAELKPDQKDSDSLPIYSHLDPILKNYVEEDKDISQIVIPDLNREEIRRVLRMVDGSEYKRRQSPPGIKITPKAFGKDRRMPITNKYRSES